VPKATYTVFVVDKTYKPKSDADDSNIDEVTVQADSKEDARVQAMKGRDPGRWRATAVIGPEGGNAATVSPRRG
jgi:hypothetical protein